MVRWSHLPVVTVLVLVTAWADSAIGHASLSQTDINRQAALTACKSQAHVQRPMSAPGQLQSLPGSPRRGSLAWQNEINRSIAACLAAKGYGGARAGSRSSSHPTPDVS
jgi:hypothetical protein